MLFGLLNFIISNMSFMGSYSNEVFPPPLSLEEENDCIIKMKNGDTDARNKLILHNLRLVAHIVKKFDTNGDDVDDLIGIGTVGLIKGIDTYSLDKKVKLTTYAAKCAENEILMYFRSNKKNINNISIYDGISCDKEGNEITVYNMSCTGALSLHIWKEDLSCLSEERTPTGTYFVTVKANALTEGISSAT